MFSSRVLLFLAVFVFPSYALATVDLIAGEFVSIHRDANPQSPILYKMQIGEKCQVAPKTSQAGWRKVRMDTPSGRIIGFINAKNLRLSQFRDRKDYIAPKTYREKWGIGGSLIAGYFLQNGEAVTAGGETFEPAKLAAPIGALAGYMEMPFEGHKLRAYVIARMNYWQGQGTSNQGNNLSLTRTEIFLGAGGSIKWYLNPKSKFWFGLGGELSKGLSATNQVSNDAEISGEEDPPFYVAGTLNFGWDHQLLKGIYFFPELRGFYNLNPVVYGGELVMSLGLGF